MGNLLTPGLLAAAFMAAINLALGNDPISWNVFIATAVAFMLNLDMGDSRVAAGSPLSHSVGCGIVLIYMAGVLVYAAGVFYGIRMYDGMLAVLAVGVGAMSHVAAEFATGQCVYTLPRRLDPASWFDEVSHDSSRFWCAWGRLSAGTKHLGDAHLNAFSVATVLLCIWLGGPSG